MRAHYCWHSASFPPPAHKYTQACDKHAHQMYKNKKVWVWSATNRKYGHWYKKKNKQKNKTHGYICRVSERPSDQQAFKNIQLKVTVWNIYGCSYFGTTVLFRTLMLTAYFSVAQISLHSTNYVFSSLFLVLSWAVLYQRSAASRSMIYYCFYYSWTDFFF